MIELEFDNVTTHVFASKNALSQISDLLSYEQPGADHIRRNMPPWSKWDGRVRLLKRKGEAGSFPAGLTQFVIDWARENDVEVSVKDGREIPKSTARFELKQKLSARDYQNTAREIAAKNERGIILVGTGGGKCHCKGTKILLYSGDIKNVEDVEVGDQLMGPDSKPRNVLSICRGREQMARVTPTKGAPWVCNVSHVLSLRCTANHSRRYKKDRILNISVRDYFRQSDKFKHMMKQWRTGVDFPEQACDDPYSKGFETGNRNRNPIPKNYLINSRRNRLEFLAGVCDSCACFRQGTHEILTRDSEFRDDLMFLARSLGFAAYSGKRACGDKFYDRITISGEIEKIPCRKSARFVRRQKKNVLNVGITVEPLPEDDYYGFEIDGDHLYLLGDFTVTHNTITSLLITSDKSVPTLFVTPDVGLKNQTLATYRHFLGDDIVGDDLASLKPVVVCNIQTLIKKPPVLFERFKMLLIDEFHHSGASSYLKLNTLLKNAYWRFGFTGTNVRTDGKDMHMHGVLSDVLFSKTASELIQAGWLVPPEITIVRIKLNGWSRLNYRDAYDKITMTAEINLLISAIAKTKFMDENKQTLILVRKKEHGAILNRLLDGHAVYLSGDDKYEYREEMKEKFLRREVKCLIATNIFGEGQDIPSIDCLINARFNKSEIQTKQGIGRALRLAEGAKNYEQSVLLGKSKADIFDFLPIGQKHLAEHAAERIRQYKSEPEFKISVVRADQN